MSATVFLRNALNSLWTVALASAPTSLGNWNDVSTAFTGDDSHISVPISYTISGTTTLQQPTAGYVFNQECSPFAVYVKNTSGWNNGTADNTGRTAATLFYAKIDNYGQGDAMCFLGKSFVDGARAGATSFLANPAGSVIAGGIDAGTDGVYLNPVEVHMQDNSHDVAGIGYVSAGFRNNETGALGCVWYGFRSQSQGSKAIDAHFSAQGKSKIGMDLTSFQSNSSGSYTRAGITALANDRIYLNATAGVSPSYAAATGTEYIDYNSSASGIEIIVGGSTAVLMTGSNVVFPHVPSSNPHIAGAVYTSSSVLMISTG